MTNRTLVLLIKLNEVLTEARKEGQFYLGDGLDMLSTDNDTSIASLVWNTESQEYEIAELMEMTRNG